MTIQTDAFLARLRPDERLPHGRKWTEQHGAIGAGIAESDFGTAEFIKDRIATAIHEDLLTYLPDELGERAAAACAWLYRSRFSWSVDTDWVRATPDVLSALVLALEIFPPATPVLIPTPCYSPFLGVARSMGRPIIEVPMPHGFDPERIAAAAPPPGSILLLCNPHNPTGSVLDRTTLTELDALLERLDLVAFVDEIHAPLVYAGSAHVPFASLSDSAANRSITAISPSKGWNIPGLKAAHAIIPNAELRAHWDRLDRHPLRSGSPLGAIGVISAYSDEGLEWLERVITRFDESRCLVARSVAELMPDATLQLPRATYLAWIDFGAYRLDIDPAEHFLRTARVSTVGGCSCGAGFEQFVRFNFAAAPETVSEAMQRMASALHAHR